MQDQKHGPVRLKSSIKRLLQVDVAWSKASLWTVRGLLLLILLLFFISGLKIVAPRNVMPLPGQSRSDFEDYLQASGEIQSGQDPYRRANMEEAQRLGDEYEPAELLNPELWPKIQELLAGMGRYLYPPLLAWLLSVLLAGSYETAALIFQVASVLALGLSWVFLLRQSENKRLELTAIAGATLICLNFLLGNIDNGNIGNFLLLLCLPGLLLSFQQNRIRNFLGGALIGLATVLKVSPVFLGLFLLAGRRFTALGGAILGGLLGLVLPAVTLGFERNFELLQNWNVFLIGNFNESVFVRPWANNQALSAALGKLLLPAADLKQSSWGLPLFFRDAYPNREESYFIRYYVRMIQRSLLLLPVVLAVYFFIKKKSSNLLAEKSGQALLYFILLISLMTSGVSWFHTFSILWIPVFLRLKGWLVRRDLQFEDKFALAVLFFFGFVFALLPSLVREGLAIYSVFTWLCLAQLGVLFWKFIRNGI